MKSCEMQMKSVYVAWQDEVTRLWHTVAKLVHDNGIYRFNYTKGVDASKRFSPFMRMEDFDKVYESKELFPVFKNRILPKNRPEYKKIIDWLDINAEEFDPLEYLGVSGGLRSTDNYRIIPDPVLSDSTYSIEFLVSGIRYLDEKSSLAVKFLKAGDELSYSFEDDNSADTNAVLLKSDGTIVGYCPRYLAVDFRTLLDSKDLKESKFRVVKVNNDAPSQYKLLCSFSTTWPDGFTPFISDEYIAHKMR